MASREIDLLWGIVVPALILLGSYAVTFALYRHFTRKPGPDGRG
jgi:hypothetical protein